MSILTSFFDYDFLWRAVIAGTLVALTCPLIGVFLVPRQLSLMGEGLGHAAFTGIALGAIIGIHPGIATLAFSLMIALAVERMRGWQHSHGDMAVAVTLYTTLALGAVLIARVPGGGARIFSYLFGSILTVGTADLRHMALLAGAILFTVFLFYKDLFAVTADEEVAKASGMPTGVLNLLLMGLTAATVTVALQAVGGLLAAALMVIPVMAAIQLRYGFLTTTLLAVLLSLVSVLLGLIIAVLFNLAPGGTIVLTASAILLLTYTGTHVFDQHTGKRKKVIKDIQG